MPARRTKLVWPWIGLGLLLALAWTWAMFFADRGEPHEETQQSVPREVRPNFVSKYRNTSPDVGYVGDLACAGCHADIAETYHRHPMGKSMATVGQAERIEQFDQTPRNPFIANGLTFEVALDGRRMFHSESKQRAADNSPIVETRVEVDYVIGSGRQGRSYLINRDGHLCMSPITWYPQKGIWDLSPGYETNNQHFNRPVLAVCLFCHANQADLDAATVNRFPSAGFHGDAIGCERCHGPGALHVDRYQRGDVPVGLDDSIVNPTDLAATLRDAVCEQCHLSGVVRVMRRNRKPFDYRPGMPLDMFWSVFVKPPAERDIAFVGHVEQFHASRCFQQSDGSMHCVSCHDPHAKPDPADRVDYFRQRCLKCHASEGCELDQPQRREASPRDDCVVCHMPRLTTEVRHAAATDHRIPRFSDSRQSRVTPPTASIATESPFVNFHVLRRKGQPSPLGGDEDADRDLGIAVMMSRDVATGIVGRSHLQSAFERLQRACQRDPNDVDALEALGHASWSLGDTGGAADAFQQVLKIMPRREFTLDSIAALSQSRGQHAAAVEYWDRAIETNPWQMKYYLRSALSHAHLHQWEQCQKKAAKALEIDPANPGARQLSIESQLGLKAFDRADREFDLLLELDADRADRRRQWYRTHPLNQRD